MSTSVINKHPDRTKTYSIIINGRPREVDQKKLTYLEVIQLAFPGEIPTDVICFTVTFSRSHGKGGTMVDGDEERVKDDMVFNVNRTDKS